MYIDKNNFKQVSDIVQENLIKQNDISFNKELQDILQSFKNYINNHSTDQDVIDYKTQLALHYQSFFTDNNLFEKFNLPNQYKYYKIQEICKKLPFYLSNTEYPNYLYHILNFDSTLYGTIANNTYPACFQLFENQNISKISVFQKQLLLNFVNNNQPILVSGKNTYLDINLEMKKYYDATHNIFHEKYEPIYNKTYEEWVYDYMNKILGNIGELFAYRIIQNFPDAVHIAKDLGNGYGYDIYLPYNQIENLIEVKTTAYNRANDSFIITDNELRVMNDTLKNPLAQFLVYRVLYTDFNRFNLFILKPLDAETLYCQDNGFTYKLKDQGNNKTFNKE